MTPENIYHDFLEKKIHSGSTEGIDAVFLPSFLKDFQSSIVEWSLKKGRSAILADCGLGKTAMQLVWAENIRRVTNKRVLILAPLAVSSQTVREGEKFGIEVTKSDGKIFPLTVSNYEKINKFNPSDFAGIVLDESSILKNFEGAIKNEVTRFMTKIPYRLLATATAAPNDFTELGTSSEALGYLGYMDMLNRFFKNDNNNSGTKRLYGEAPEWRLKGHSEIPFWRWVTSWARAFRKPSDLGFSDSGFTLPPVIYNRHEVLSRTRTPGKLFSIPGRNLREQREEVKRTVVERCEKAASLVNETGKSAIVWCHLNEEGDLLEKIIKDSIQVSGKDSDSRKEEKFIDFTELKSRVLICKPKIGAWGMNWQHCSHIVYFPSHSFESFYQSVRRCHRFGQRSSVTVDIVLTEGESLVMENLAQKEGKATRMFENLVNEMNHSLSINRIDNFTKKEVIPSWL